MLPAHTGRILLHLGPRLYKVLYSMGAMLLVPLLCSCVCYTFGGYSRVHDWYLSLNNCFYKSDEWAIRFFTPLVYEKGRVFALMGILVAVAAQAYLLYLWKKVGALPHRTITISLKGWGWYVLVAALALAACLQEWQLMAPAYDEIFSAVNCAELHPFQTLSYYMLPNNHLLYNTVNGLLFGWNGHLVGTGRLLSALAYAGVLMLVFHWFTRVLGSRFYALVATLPVALQFLTWGMSAQARGYECQLLCGWATIVLLLRHYEFPSRYHWPVGAVINFIGFALIPSWFYFYAAQLLFMTAAQLGRQQIDFRYRKYQLGMLGLVFLFYLPALCFSGTAALAGNKYVLPATDALSAFLPALGSTGAHFISYCFSYLAVEGSIQSYVLFCAPLVLFFTRKRTDRALGGMYLSVWVAYIVCSLFIKHVPFHRTLIVQFSCTMAAVVVTLFRLAALIMARIRNTISRTVIRVAVFVLPVLLCSGYLWRFNQKSVNDILYGNNVNGTYQLHMADIAQLAPGSSVGFSQESFYFFYHCRRLGFNASRCANGTERYYVKRTDEQLPPRLESRYVLLRKGGDDYEIYEHK